MSVQREQIIQTAISILDRDGLEGVTLRRLAKDLDIKAASIYWHIASKEVLLDEMANAILEEHFGSFDFENDQREWAEWLDTLMHELRAAMLAHREGARVVAGAHPDIARMLVKLWDLTIRVLHNNGFSVGKAAMITVTAVNFTFGSVIEEQASPPNSLAPDDRSVDAVFESEEFRMMAKAMEQWEEADRDALFGDALFDTGVRIMINGVRVELESESKDAD